MGDFSFYRTCTECNSTKTGRLIYGYPTRFDFEDGEFYGGSTFTFDSPSHFCHSCNITWRIEQQLPRELPFPERCYFCEGEMTELDKFTYGTEFESWFDQDDSFFKLEHGTFNFDPLPTCSDCRESIRDNQKAMAKEEERDEAFKIWARLGWALFAAILVVVLFLNYLFA